MAPRVSVVLINLNSFGLTESCVKSLIETEYENLLVIIIDNGSRPDELSKLTSLAKRWPNVLIHDMGYNSGFTKANNKGIQIALEHNSDYIWILNNDTEVRKDSIQMFLRAFDEFNLDKKNTILSSIITYADWQHVWCNGLRDLPLVNFPKSIDKNRPVTQVAQPGLVLKRVQYGVGCSMFLAKEFIEAHGPMNEAFFIYYDDLDFSMGRENLFIQQPLVSHKVSSTSGYKGKTRYSPFQAFLMAKNGVYFYFHRKKIPWYEKIVYLGFTVWVFVLLYVRDLPTLKAFLSGLRAGLRGDVEILPPGVSPGPNRAEQTVPVCGQESA